MAKKAYTNRPRRDVYQEVTNKIVTSIENGVLPWAKPWKNSRQAGGILPHNAVTGHTYRGMNTILLWCTDQYSSQAYLTFKQAQQLGGNVRKGEHGSAVVFWKFFDQTDDDGRPNGKKIPFVRMYTVFNVEQCDGLPAAKSAAPGVPVDDFAARVGARLCVGGNEACYMPSVDRVHMPRPEQFESAEAYKRIEFHELTHWTGHKSRLDRDLSGRFGSDAYAAEELIAEIGAAMVGAHYGLAAMLRHAAYVESWLKVLKADKRAIFTAASKAQEAADYLIERAESAASESEAA